MEKTLLNCLKHLKNFKTYIDRNAKNNYKYWSNMKKTKKFEIQFYYAMNALIYLDDLFKNNCDDGEECKKNNINIHFVKCAWMHTFDGAIHLEDDYDPFSSMSYDYGLELLEDIIHDFIKMWRKKINKLNALLINDESVRNIHTQDFELMILDYF